MPREDARVPRARKIKMTLKQAQEVIRKGGSVIVAGHNNNEPISDLTRLPSASAFAAGDPEKEKATEKELEAQMAEIQGELAKIRAAGKPPEGQQGPQEAAGEADGSGTASEADEGQEGPQEGQERAPEGDELAAEHEEGPLSRRARRNR